MNRRFEKPPQHEETPISSKKSAFATVCLFLGIASLLYIWGMISISVNEFGRDAAKAYMARQQTSKISTAVVNPDDNYPCVDCLPIQ